MITNHKFMKMALIIIAILIFGVINQVEAQDKKDSGHDVKISQRDLPQAVLAAFQNQYPAAKIKELGKEVKDSVAYYEIDSVDGKVKRALLYTVDGTIAEIEEVIAKDQLPEIVKTAITNDYPHGKVERAEKVTKNAVVTYEVKLESGEDNIEAVYDTLGKIIKSEKKTEEDENDND
jgi:hypothetical protein